MKTNSHKSKKIKENTQEAGRPKFTKRYVQALAKKEIIVPYCERTDWSIDYGCGSE